MAFFAVDAPITIELTWLESGDEASFHGFCQAITGAHVKSVVLDEHLLNQSGAYLKANADHLFRALLRLQMKCVNSTTYLRLATPAFCEQLLTPRPATATSLEQLEYTNAGVEDPNRFAFERTFKAVIRRAAECRYLKSLTEELSHYKSAKDEALASCVGASDSQLEEICLHGRNVRRWSSPLFGGKLHNQRLSI